MSAQKNQRVIDQAFKKYGRLGTREVQWIAYELDITRHRVVTLLQDQVIQGKVEVEAGFWKEKES